VQLYINDRQLNDDHSGLSKTELLHKISKCLEDEIIESIYIDDVEVNIDYFKGSNTKVSELKRIKFLTKKTGKLVEETLLQAQEYLPKLKEGLLETSSLFRKEKLAEANQNYQFCLDGIDWYIKALNHILPLLEDQKLREEGKQLLDRFNKAITTAMVAAQKNKLEKVANTLEYEVVGFIDKFIIFNETLLIKE